MSAAVIIDQFAGAGGWSEGLRMLGLAEVGYELDKTACATARAAGHARVQADVAAVDLDLLLAEHGTVWGLIGSPPCFPGGTPVVTARGVIPIEEVRVGDQVLTHRNRWRPVQATMSRTAPVYADGWLTATADHPFWTRRQVRTWDNAARRSTWQLADPEWTHAGDMHGQYVGMPEAAEQLPVPPVPGRPVEMGAAFWYMTGRWLGDGWVRLAEADPASPKPRAGYSRVPAECGRGCGAPAARHGRYPHLWTAYCSSTCAAAAARDRRITPRSEILICCDKAEADALAGKLADTGLTWTRSEQRTTTRFSASHTGLARWLVDHFGRYAHGKTLPGWALAATEDTRAGILDGYLAADGSASGRGWSATTVSANLAVAIRLLATSLGYVTNLTCNRAKRDARIEGRAVTERPAWQIRMTPDEGRYTRSIDGHQWTKRRRPMTYRGDEPVYDITVAEDHSFVAHGFVVHNCQAWSRAGKRKGILDQPRIFRFLGAIIRHAKADPRTAFDNARAEDLAGNPEPWHDDRSRLVLEPIRWVLALSPRWVALEQVPDVLPFWDRCAVLLRILGYSVWTGVLSAERFGVPQTRARAILMASLDRKVTEPPATHHAYNPRAIEQDTLFEVDLLDWVSMAEALGWHGADTLLHAQRGAGSEDRHGTRPGRPATQPAFTVTTGGGEGGGTGHVLRRITYRNGNQANAAERLVSDPAPTVMFSARGNDVRWVARSEDDVPDAPPPTHMLAAGRTSPDTCGAQPRPVDEPAATLTGAGTAVWMQSNQTSDTAAQEKATRSADAPSLTLTGNTRSYSWITERPATTVQGDARVWPPGHKVNGDDQRRLGEDAANDRYGDRAGPESVRVTVEEAAVLQSVRPDYPWQGSRTKQYEQVGNLIPPLLAVAVLGHLLGLDWQPINRAAYRTAGAA